MRKWIFIVIMILQILWVSTAVIADDESIQERETPSGILFSHMEKAIDDFAERYVGVSTPGAAVAVVKDGTIIFSKGYGYSDLEADEAVDSSATIFEWGSITKLFTWTALMQLEERGHINFSDDVRIHLPETFADKLKGIETITIMDLMNHTTGFGDYGFDLIESTPEDSSTLTEALLKSHPAQYMEVGRASAYSNYGTGIAGLIIEHVTGLTYDHYMSENFYTPLKMDNTTADPFFRVSEEMKEAKALGYYPNNQGGFDPGFWSYVGMTSAGSLNGTVEDLARFAIALTPANEKTPLFRERATLDRMFTSTYFNMAHGFFEYDGEIQGYGHGGNTAGFTGQLVVVPGDRFAVITLTNVAGEKDFAFGIQELLTGKRDFDFEPTIASLPDSSEVEGLYIPFRRPEGSFLELMSYLSPFSIHATAENEITLTMATYHQRFIQTSPYYYEIAGNETPLFNIMFSDLLFKMDKGKVVQMTTGRGFDLQPLEKASSGFTRIGSLIVVVLFILIGLLGTIITTVSLVKGRKQNSPKEQQRYHRLQLGIKLLGGFMVVSNATALGFFLVNNLRSFSEVRPFLLLNFLWVFLLLAGTAFSFRLEKNGGISKFRKVIDRMYMVLFYLMIAVLMYWNFFSIHG